MPDEKPEPIVTEVGGDAAIARFSNDISWEWTTDGMFTLDFWHIHGLVGSGGQPPARRLQARIVMTRSTTRSVFEGLARSVAKNERDEKERRGQVSPSIKPSIPKKEGDE